METYSDINGNKFGCNLKGLSDDASIGIVKENSINNGKSLLVDCINFSFTKDNLFEQAVQDPTKKLIVKGILQRAGTKNMNGRVYPLEVLRKQAELYTENFIKQRRALGELDHPNDSVVNLKNVSHNILEMHWEGPDLVGTIEILPTPSGKILRDLFASNISLGISSRGLGNVKHETTNEGMADVVSDDFELLSFDFVSNPSTQGAFMRPVGSLNESVSPSINNKPILSLKDAHSLVIDKLMDLADDYQAKMMAMKPWHERNPSFRNLG